MNAFGKYSYMCAGGTETIKGLLAFVASPVFGRLSDKIGHQTHVFMSVSPYILYKFVNIEESCPLMSYNKCCN